MKFTAEIKYTATYTRQLITKLHVTLEMDVESRVERCRAKWSRYAELCAELISSSLKNVFSAFNPPYKGDYSGQ